jgi:hypothetical protein
MNYGNMWKLHVLISSIRDMKNTNYDKRRIPTYLIANIPTLIINELRIIVKQDTMVAI